MEFQNLILKEEAPVATIRLNRPEKRNALSMALMQEVMTALRQASSKAEMRVIVIEAAGVAFSAGHDLGEMVGREGVFYQRLFDLCSQMMEMLHRVPQPVIAKIHGVATAAGCQLVAAC
ncbi:MAG TPA: enoyl-CoA hydratase-related protein, partial [Actinomycetota bacterium]|nr:enoyl-CoA hydratase-related protein [Actinomycetota bacterium]